jgi:uncharacterized protein (TIGR00251 family)
MSSHPVRVSGSDVTIDVWVVPNSSRSGIAGLHGDKVKIRVSAPPEGGKANAHVADILESTLGVPVRLVRGMSGRHKVFKVTGLDPELICRKLGV